MAKILLFAVFVSFVTPLSFLPAHKKRQSQVLSQKEIAVMTGSLRPSYHLVQINCCYPDNQDDEVAIGARCVTGGSQFCVPNECPEGTAECGINKK